MKLWVVYYGEYCGTTDQATLYGVFSSEEKAKAWGSANITPEVWKDGTTFTRYEIVECELDAPIPIDPDNYKAKWEKWGVRLV